MSWLIVSGIELVLLLAVSARCIKYRDLYRQQQAALASKKLFEAAIPPTVPPAPEESARSAS